MSKTTFTSEEAAQVAAEFFRQRVDELAKHLRELRDRELKKTGAGIVPPHKLSDSNNTAESGTVGVPGNMNNPRGKKDALKAAPKMEETSGDHAPEETSGDHPPEETSVEKSEKTKEEVYRERFNQEQQVKAKAKENAADRKVWDEHNERKTNERNLTKEELCKKCGKSHDLEKGCTPLDMDKAMLKDSKGKEKDNGIHPDSVLPDDKTSEEVSADGSGGQIKKGKGLKKAVAVPTAKPPSGNLQTPVSGQAPKNPAMDAKPVAKGSKTMTVPASKPRNNIAVAHSKRGGAGAGAHSDKRPSAGPSASEWDYEDSPAPKKEDLDKAGLSTEAKQHGIMEGSRQAAQATAAPAKPVVLPSPKEQEARASTFADFMPPAGKTGHTPTQQVGIFSRLGKSQLTKASPVLTDMPKLKNPENPNIKQGYAGEYEDAKTKALPHGGNATELGSVGVNPKRGEMGGPQPHTRDELDPKKVWSPGQTITNDLSPEKQKALLAPSKPVGIFARIKGLFGKSGLPMEKGIDGGPVGPMGVPAKPPAVPATQPATGVPAKTRVGQEADRQIGIAQQIGAQAKANLGKK